MIIHLPEKVELELIRRNINLITNNDCILFPCPKRKIDPHNAYFDHIFRYGIISAFIFAILQIVIFKPFKNKIGTTLFTYIFVWQMLYTSPFLWWYLAAVYKAQLNQMKLKSDNKLLYLEST